MKSLSLFDGFGRVFEEHSRFACGKKISLSLRETVFLEAKDAYMFCLSSKLIKHVPTCIVEHADEYTSFIAFLAQAASRSGDLDLALAAYLVNRRVNNFDCFYTRNLPPVFHLEHPLGSVIGNASFGNYLVVYQGVSVGGDLKLRYPCFGEGVALFARSSVIGDCSIGSNVAIGSGVQVFAERIDSNTAVSLRMHARYQAPINWSVRERFFK